MMVDKLKNVDLVQLYKMVMIGVMTLLLGITTFTLNRLVVKLDATANMTQQNLIFLTEVKKDVEAQDCRISDNKKQIGKLNKTALKLREDISKIQGR